MEVRHVTIREIAHKVRISKVISTFHFNGGSLHSDNVGEICTGGVSEVTPHGNRSGYTRLYKPISKLHKGHHQW